MITLNPNDKGGGVSLLNNNMGAYMTGGSVRATQGKSKGKWYWEITTDSSSSYLLLGIETSLANINQFCGYDLYGYSYYQVNGNKFHSSNISYASEYSGSHIIGVAMDLDSGYLAFYKDGGYLGIAYEIPCDIVYYPAVSNASSAVGSTVTNINFGRSKFQYQIPTGYLPYDSPSSFLIQDGNSLCRTLDGSELMIPAQLPYTKANFDSYGMLDLSKINSNIINKLINQKYNIGLLK